MNLNRMTTAPLDVPRSMRRHGIKALTSMPAGKVVPLFAVPLLREDACKGAVRLGFEMAETAELLMNAVYVDVKAYLVPWLAFERFGGSMDIFNRSYNGLPPLEGEDVIPFFETHAMGAHGSKALYKYMGLHAKTATNVNTMFAEAYNAIWNFRAQMRSKEITKRDKLDVTLAPAFWRHENFAHIVPDFDQAVMDGEVALNLVEGGLTGKVDVLYKDSSTNAWRAKNATNNAFVASGQTIGHKASGSFGVLDDPTGVTLKLDPMGGLEVDVGAIYDELAESGITISLAKIEQARKTQAFARIREKYAEHDEEFIIDMLMSGISIPDQNLKQPILLAERSNVFGMNKRYSTDADALDTAAVNGMSQADLSIRVPKLNTGGVIMVTAEVTPEQLFERKKDVWFHLGSVAELPEYLRDSLDDQPVEEVKNDFVDTDHATPNDLFGYAPMNHRFSDIQYKIGGHFYRPTTNTTSDDYRQRLWAVETVNPVLSADFYLCTTMHQKPFLDTVADPFEAVAVGNFMIEGNTVFGGVLVEAMNNYAEVMAKAPTDRVTEPA